MHIEEALENEFNIIQFIAGKTWPVTYGNILSQAQLDYMLKLFYSNESLTSNIEDGHKFLLVWDNNQPLGFAGIQHFYNNHPVTKIHKIYVLPESQGTGAGTLLMNHIIQEATAAGANHISLNVNRFNPAISFYKRFGFKVIKEEDINLEHGYLMEDYVMEKTLGW